VLIGWQIARTILTPEDNWHENLIDYRVASGNGAFEPSWSLSQLFIRNSGGRCLPSLAAGQNKVFVIGNFDEPDSRAVLALDSADGKLLWRNDNPDGYQYTGLTIGPSGLYSGSGGNATLAAQDLNTGEVFWSNRMWGRYVDCFRVFDPLIHVGTNKGRYLVQVETGETVYQFDGVTSEDELHRLATQYKIPSTDFFESEILWDVVYTENIIFKGGEAYDRKSGSRLWGIDGIISNIATTDTAAYLLTKDRQLLGVDSTTGEVFASVQFEPVPQEIGVHGYDNTFYVAVDEKAKIVYAFLGDGAQLFAFKLIDVSDDVNS
jgi:outer membrane protein assembly factor BamB